ncbi:MAG: hypothetical protein UX81_C0021G0002 [Parcubacteria group bacterium GW2011_GWA2_47_12]|nr:MAG: hypothetical protein UX81_C0021G0002 [Parcubacteria group bacterium GW2011_GWA2_47_12]
MRPGGVSPVPLCGMTSPPTGGLVTNRGNALGRGESSPQLEMGTAHLLVFEPFPYPRTGARSPSGNSRGGCRGCIPFRLDTYDMMNEGTEHLYLGLCRIPNLAEFKKILAEENGILIPKIFVSILRVHFELAHW